MILELQKTTIRSHKLEKQVEKITKKFQASDFLLTELNETVAKHIGKVLQYLQEIGMMDVNLIKIVFGENHCYIGRGQ